MPVLLSLIKYRKSLYYIGGILVVATILPLSYYFGYNKAKTKYDKEFLILEQSQKIQSLQNMFSISQQQLVESHKLLEAEKNNVKVITKYHTKKEIIEKEVPKIERIIDANVNSDYVSDDIVRLHDEFVCKTRTLNDYKISEDGSSCRIVTNTKGIADNSVTQKDFIKRVIGNYQIATENKLKLEALQATIKEAPIETSEEIK